MEGHGCPDGPAPAVKTHVSHILQKLALDSRVQLARGPPPTALDRWRPATGNDGAIFVGLAVRLNFRSSGVANHPSYRPPGRCAPREPAAPSEGHRPHQAKE